MREGLELEAGRRGNAAERYLHTGFEHGGVVCADVLGLVCVVHHDELKLDTVDASLGVDLVDSHLGAVFNGNAVNRCAAGQRAGSTYVIFGVVLGIVDLGVARAGREARDCHEQYKCE